MHSRFFTGLRFILALNAPHAVGFAQSTAFTYQGRLQDTAGPLTGGYDLQVTLWDDATGGNRWGPTLTNAALPVSNGVFTTTLDFGPGVFNGGARWLEIGVRTNAGGDFARLTPRQALLPVPYAFWAANASQAVTVSGTVPASGLNGLYSNPVNFNNPGNGFTGSFAGNGASVSNVNAVLLGGRTAAQFWQTGGNTGTSPATGFLGTADNQSLELRVNSQRALRLEPDLTSPNILAGAPANTVVGGIYGAAVLGGGNASYPNRVGNNYATVVGGISNSASGTASIAMGQFNTASGYAALASGYSTWAGGFSSFAAGNSARALHDGSFVWADNNAAHFASTTNNQFLIRAGGGVGINTNNPAGAALAVRGNTTVDGSTTLNGVSTLNGTATVNGNVTVNGMIKGGYAGNVISNGVLGGFIGGGGSAGFENRVGAHYAAVAGGVGNVASGYASLVAGENSRTSGRGSIALGWGTLSTSDGSVALGVNTVASAYDAVAMGYLTRATNDNATALGQGSIAGGWDSVAMGTFTVAAGHYCTAAGYYAQANHPGSFVWADATSATPFATTANNQFLVRASGGLGINTPSPGATLHVNGTARVQGGNNWDVNNTEGDFRVGNESQRFKIGIATSGGGAGDVWMRAQGGTARLFLKTPGGTTFFSNEGQTAGVTLASGDGSWTSVSDRNVKENFAPVNPQEVLDKVATLPLSTWNYKSQEATIRHLGPMAQDFKAAFGLGESDTGITTVDADGVALAAIQGLNQKLEEARDENRELRERLEQVEALLRQLVKKSPESRQP